MRLDILDCERGTPGLSEQIKIVRSAEVPQEVVQLGEEEHRREETNALPVQLNVRERVPVLDARSTI